eukprot:3125420-Rhodomonas_salina.3
MTESHPNQNAGAYPVGNTGDFQAGRQPSRSEKGWEVGLCAARRSGRDPSSDPKFWVRPCVSYSPSNVPARASVQT